VLLASDVKNLNNKFKHETVLNDSLSVRGSFPFCFFMYFS